MPVRKLRLITYSLLALSAAATILASTATAQTFQVLHPFSSAAGPNGALTLDASGNLYGTTEWGGNDSCVPPSSYIRFDYEGCGTIWKLSHNSNGSWTSAILYTFGWPDGILPLGGLVFDSAGNLYGTASAGGPNDCKPAPGCGVVFELKPNSGGGWAYSKLHSFDFSDGAVPLGSLVFDSAGNLYGTTQYGGSNPCLANGYGCGVVFKLARNSDGTWTYSIVHNFAKGPEDGFDPGGLTIDESGNLYGMTQSGGALESGVFFELTANTDETWTEKILHNFDPNTDPAPGSTGHLTFDASGNLYGTAQPYTQGDGTIFKLSPNADGTWTDSLVYEFPGSTAGAYPYGDLTFDKAGNLYGVTLGGGPVCPKVSEPCGTVFKLTPSSGGWSGTTLHVFSGYGAYPSAPILIDSTGHLYGTTIYGTGNYGLVFEITP